MQILDGSSAGDVILHFLFHFFLFFARANCFTLVQSHLPFSLQSPTRDTFALEAILEITALWNTSMAPYLSARYKKGWREWEWQKVVEPQEMKKVERKGNELNLLEWLLCALPEIGNEKWYRQREKPSQQ